MHKMQISSSMLPGGTGNGVFQEAKSLNESGDKKFGLSVLTGDQSDEGEYTLNGEKKNFTLTSHTESSWNSSRRFGTKIS